MQSRRSPTRPRRLASIASSVISIASARRSASISARVHARGSAIGWPSSISRVRTRALYLRSLDVLTLSAPGDALKIGGAPSSASI